MLSMTGMTFVDGVRYGTLCYMSRPMLEVIALSAEDAVAAQAGGADRLELVTEMAADGLTPDLRTFTAIRAAVDLPLRVMLRAADGFAAGDVDALCRRAQALREAGADEFVLGFLRPDGTLDVPAVQALVAALAGGHWTFHRAIDHSADRMALRRELAGLPGLDTYLSGGSAHGVDDGMPVLLSEADRAAAGEPGFAPRLMVGGGLRLDHLPTLRAAGVEGFHIGNAARRAGWDGPVDAETVRRWRTALDAPVPAPLG